MKNILKMTGKTAEGKRVITGAFKLFDTYGIPLDLIVESLNNNDMIVDWYQFVIDAKKAGWKDKRIQSAIEASLIDSGCYSKDYIEVIKDRL